jgi:RNA polymerase sigma-32 factor
MTLEELGEEFGVSRERVRQIEVRAFEKVKRAV